MAGSQHPFPPNFGSGAQNDMRSQFGGPRSAQIPGISSPSQQSGNFTFHLDFVRINFSIYTVLVYCSWHSEPSNLQRRRQYATSNRLPYFCTTDAAKCSANLATASITNATKTTAAYSATARQYAAGPARWASTNTGPTTGCSAASTRCYTTTISASCMYKLCVFFF